MTQKKTYLSWLLGLICAFSLMIVFLITSVEAVAYWTPHYYENEYTDEKTPYYLDCKISGTTLKVETGSEAGTYKKQK